MRARTGKIARLPDALREQLNQRLINGARAKDLVAWLNNIPEVKAILAEFFGGKPIREQNISEWRAGGYQDWLENSESRLRVLKIAAEQEALSGDRGRDVIERHTEFVLAAELAEKLESLHKIKNGDTRWRRFQKISLELARLRDARTRGMVIKLRGLKFAARQFGLLRPSPANSGPQK